MSQPPSIDPVPHLDAVAEALAGGGLPGSGFAALDRAMAATIGHKLFTILLLHPTTGESERFYTNQPNSYPVGGRKPLNQTPWSKQVLEKKQPYIGYTAEDIKSVFFDHVLIASLGCDSVLNLPVVHAGRVLGTVNLLHEARWYGEGHLPLGRAFAALAIPLLQSLSR